MICNNCQREKGTSARCPWCSAISPAPAAAHQLPAGTAVGGRYIIGSVLGEGGFGITYLARDSRLDCPVAVKEYFPHGFSYRNTTVGNEIFISESGANGVFIHGRERFLDEAKTLAKFSRESGIVNVTDFIEENNTAYLIMEYLEGITLKAYLKQRGVMSARDAFKLLEPVMRSLEKVHRIGIIHRDISPDNIMILSDGTPKLVDFGAARDYIDSERSLSVMLKKGYAPEEQYRSNGEQGPWTDVYAICATLYRCITGSVPPESLDRLVGDTLQPPSALGADIPPEFERTLLYGLAIRKKDRCPDMGKLRFLFNQALTDQPKTPAAAKTVDENKTLFADPAEPFRQVDDSNRTLAADPEERESDIHAPLAGQHAQGPEERKSYAGIISVIVFILVLGISIWFTLGYGKIKEKKEAAPTEAKVITASATDAPEPLTEAMTEAPTESLTLSYYTEYTNNAQGYMIKELNYDQDGTLTRRYEAQVDSAGNRTHLTHYDADGNVTQEDKYEYNSHGDVTSYIAQLPGEDGVRGFYYEYEYDAQGHMTREITYNIVRTLLSDESYEYDSSGRLVHIVTTESILSDKSESEIEYDENGNKIKTTFIDEDGKLSGWDEYEYDTKGNLIGEKEYHTTIDNTPTLSTITKYEYDANGYLIKELTYHPW